MPSPPAPPGSGAGLLVEPGVEGASTYYVVRIPSCFTHTHSLLTPLTHPHTPMDNGHERKKEGSRPHKQRGREQPQLHAACPGSGLAGALSLLHMEKLLPSAQPKSDQDSKVESMSMASALLALARGDIPVPAWKSPTQVAV